MDLYEYEILLKNLETKCENISKMLNLDSLKSHLKELTSICDDPNFWNDKESADKASRAEVLKSRSDIAQTIEKYESTCKSVKDSIELFNIAKLENDNETMELLFLESNQLESLVKSIEIEFMLNKEHDSSNAILTIQPGAGGTEGQDWGHMLYRMYLRYSERKGYKVELLDYQDGEEAGIKGVAILIKGNNAYGYLKNESGVHRLVRNSPFDSNGKRHTSFVSVQVSPELDSNIKINIDDKDIRIDTYRASGAGGQHVNKTESAIRITHLPTGIVVQCQNDRSQHKNKATAFKMLASKLYTLEKQKQSQSINSNEKTLIGWGHQIRSYVLSPYQQVKDLRSNLAISDSDFVLDGGIDELIQSVLIWENSTESNQ